jgi:hypothetical protein
MVHDITLHRKGGRVVGVSVDGVRIPDGSIMVDGFGYHNIPGVADISRVNLTLQGRLNFEEDGKIVIDLEKAGEEITRRIRNNGGIRSV